MTTSPQSLSLNITQHLIDKASEQNSSRCMIAQAVRLTGASSVHVTAESVSFNFDETRYVYPLPAKAAHELLKFDENKRLVKPFTFVLDGRLATTRPVIRRPAKGQALGRVQQPGEHAAEKKTYAPRALKRSVRRFHGLKSIVPAL